MNNVPNFFTNMEKFMHESDKAFRRIFAKYIKGNFLIEMKHFIINTFPEWFKYYDLQMDMEKAISGGNISFDYDICKLIIGCHSSNTIFLSTEERIKLEKSSEYKEKLAQQVIQNIKLRRYGSKYFRKQPILQGELFINYNVPYNLFVMSVRIHEIIHQQKFKSIYLDLYIAIANKGLAALSLLEDNFLDNCYPLCRVLLELYAKLLFKKYPNLVKGSSKFADYEVRQACCEQEYPEEFNELFKERKNKGCNKKIEFLHYGWVDCILDYHKLVKNQPYSINGVLSYLLESKEIDVEYCNELKSFYKMCNGYVHGNTILAKYPLLDYFFISIILHYVIFDTYQKLCEEIKLDRSINNVDIVEKAENDFKVLYKQYQNRTTENFEEHYKRKY